MAPTVGTPRTSSSGTAAPARPLAPLTAATSSSPEGAAAVGISLEARTASRATRLTIPSEENGAALLAAAAAALDEPLAARWFGAAAEDEEADVSDARETLCSRVEAREDRVVVAAELLRKLYCSFVFVFGFELEFEGSWVCDSA